MNKKDILDVLVNNYHGDEKELKKMKKAELKEILDEYEDHSDLFPNDDEYDGSHPWD